MGSSPSKETTNINQTTYQTSSEVGDVGLTGANAVQLAGVLGKINSEVALAQIDSINSFNSGFQYTLNRQLEGVQSLQENSADVLSSAFTFLGQQARDSYDFLETAARLSVGTPGANERTGAESVNNLVLVAGGIAAVATIMALNKR